MSQHITRYDIMPIPPVEAQTEWFDAGAIRLGVEYRLLNDAIAASAALIPASGDDPGAETFDDRGVSIHVVGIDGDDALEYLRFDCFDEDPHYHYVCWGEKSNEIAHIDPVAEGDPLSWALDRIRMRLPAMLVRAGAQHIADRLEPERIERILPRVAEAAYRARYHHDADERLLSDALGRNAS